jgi:hypothetical protein
VEAVVPGRRIATVLARTFPLAVLIAAVNVVIAISLVAVAGFVRKVEEAIVMIAAAMGTMVAAEEEEEVMRPVLPWRRQRMARTSPMLGT